MIDTIALQNEMEGEDLPYLTDEDFSRLPDFEKEQRVRLESLATLQKHYKDFRVFLTDVMVELGFSVTKIQADIADFIVNGGKNIMVEAQRSQAKTTIAAAFCIWALLHDPKLRVLIISAGGSLATDISTLIIRIILNMDVLECMRPDKSHGDRVSVEKFDLHYSIRKLDKSASVSCCGITANLQGRRADILLADDIESQKNSLTALMREQLLAKTLDFTSICQSGRIIYLGTPQSSDSIYNTLPGRGYTVRVWPGRFPTPEQLPYYGEHLAPLLRGMLERYPQLTTGGGVNGDQGVPIDPTLLGEDLLQAKEKDQGPAWFQLQHMLNTKLMDAERYPLKTDHIISMPLRLNDSLPLEIKRGYEYIEYQVEGRTFRFAKPHPYSGEIEQPTGVCFYIDPAGGGKGRGTQGGDETGWCCTAFLNSTIYVLGYGGFKGGYDGDTLTRLADTIAKYKPNVVKIEQNYGFGAFMAVFTPILRKVYDTCELQHDFVTGQKELRIIDTLEPIIARGSLVINQEALANERYSLAVHPDVSRMSYCLMHQLDTITRDKDSLVHDDRLDALAGACAHWEELLRVDHEEARQRIQADIDRRFWADPLGHNRYSRGPSRAVNNILTYRHGR